MLRFAALLPFVMTAFRWMLYTQAGRIVVGALGFLGLNFAAQKVVMEPGIDYMRSLMMSGPVGEYGVIAMQWMGVLRFDQAVSMILSAWLMVQTIKSARIALNRVTT